MVLWARVRGRPKRAMVPMTQVVAKMTVKRGRKMPRMLRKLRKRTSTISKITVGIRSLIGGLLLVLGILPAGFWGVRALKRRNARISAASVAAWLVSLVLISLGVLEMTGVLSVGRLFSEWLLVQEINPF